MVIINLWEHLTGLFLRSVIGSSYIFTDFSVDDNLD